MGALGSLSKSATVVFWYISVICTFGFGAVFLFGWLSEEFATSTKWKKRRKLLIVVAIIGVTGEQLATIAEFALSEHLQTIFAKELEEATGWRQLTQSQKDKMHAVLIQHEYGAAIVSSWMDPEAEKYATDFVAVQKGANWVTTFNKAWTHQDPGLFLTTVGGGDSPSTAVMKKALEAADVPFKEISVSDDDHSIPGGFQKGVTYLMIGRKPRG